MTTPTSLRWPMSDRARVSCSMNSKDSALRFSGRSSVSVAIRSASAMSTRSMGAPDRLKLNSQRNSPGSALDQHAGIHDPRWVQRAPCRLVRLGKELRPLLVVPGPVIATDRVVVCDRPASGEQGVRGGALDLGPLVELGSRAALCQDRVVGR